MRFDLIFLSLFSLYACSGGQKEESDKNKKDPGVEVYSEAFLSSGNNFANIRKSNIKAADDSIMLKGEESQSEVFPVRDTIIQPFIDSISRIGYSIEKSLPEGYVKNATVDYTTYIQKAINTHPVLIFPGFPILINDRGLRIPSDRKILFLQGSKLILEPNNKGNYKIIYFNKASNISLYNPVIVGDRYQHIGSKGEWGMGISMYSSGNIKIYNADISNCWGDGIYIGQAINGPPPNNITIVDAYCHNNRRNGITLTSGININLINLKMVNSDGTLPMAGIDIEPNSPEAELKNILIKDPYTADNLGKGIQIGLGRLIKEGIKPVSIEIDNHWDVGSKTALVLSCSPGKGINTLINNKNDSIGYIKISNPIWTNNTSVPLRANGYRTTKIRLKMINPKIIDSSNLYINKNTIRAVLKRAIGSGGNIDIQD